MGEIIGWAALAMVVVIVSIILVKFKTVTGMTAALNSSIDTYVTAFLEPKNWVSIVIIAIIGISLVVYFVGKFKSMNK